MARELYEGAFREAVYMGVVDKGNLICFEKSYCIAQV